MVIKQCIICGKEFDTKNRSPNAITCSKECSKERKKRYDRKFSQVYDKQRYQNHRDEILIRNSKYRDQHPEKCDKHKREKETPGLKEAKIMARQNANYQCELTGWSGALRVHHLNGYAFFPDQRIDLNNLIVLHDNVHKDFHSIYGYKGNNTIEQFSEFVYQNFPLQFDQFRMSKYKYLPEHIYNT